MIIIEIQFKIHLSHYYKTITIHFMSCGRSAPQDAVIAHRLDHRL